MLFNSLLFSSLALLCASAYPVQLDVDWPSFLARSDLYYNWSLPGTSPPNEWVKSLFGGNGQLGFMLWQPSPTLTRIEVSRQSVYDDRNASLPAFLDNFVYDSPRLPIGHFELPSPPGTTFVSGVGRVSLYDARATLVLTTSSGSTVSLAVWACAAYEQADVIAVEATWTSTFAPSTPIAYLPDSAQSTWVGRDSRYVLNPPPVNTSTPHSSGGVLNVSTQAHLIGTSHSTAVLEVGATPTSTTLFLSVSPVMEGGAAPSTTYATSQVEAAATLGLTATRALHESWWHGWWPVGGVITMEYSILESFFYIQLYKFASGARQGRGVHDLEGPWFVTGTDWPDLHWDLNIQYPYYFPSLVNRPDVASTIVDFMGGLHASGQLSKNVPVDWAEDASAVPTGASSLRGEMSCYWSYGPNCTTSPPSVTGNLLWSLHVLHMAADLSGNSSIHTSVVWPLLERALQFHSHFTFVDSNGTVHLEPTFSPEYPGPVGEDANYDVSLFRWGLQLAIDLSERYGLNSPYLPAWKSTLANFTFFPIDNRTNTLSIYRGIPYGTPHRHFSHLFSIWPLHLLNVSDPQLYEVARDSINLWLATPEEDSQFYRPAASAMNVILGQLPAAFDNITYLLHTRIEGSTFYREGSQGSCTETPYAAAWATANLLLQSWNTTQASIPPGATVIDIFPGIADTIPLTDSPYAAAPAKVSSASFYRLSASGGVLVSGKREVVVHNITHYLTRTTFVGVETPGTAESGGRPLVLRLPMARPLSVLPAGTPFTEIGDGGLVQVSLIPGGSAVFYSSTLPTPTFSIAPLDGCPAEFNHWGLLNEGASTSAGGEMSAAAATATSTPVVLRNCSYDGEGRVSPSQRYTFSGGRFEVQDGSGRCLGVASCEGGNGDLVVLAPCAPPPTPDGGLPIGCEGGGGGCSSRQQNWTVVGKNLANVASGGKCMDVHGSFDPNTIDVWDCANGSFLNQDFVWSDVSGGILSLDTDACCINKCLTPAS